MKRSEAMIAAAYEYPAGGRYNETVAVMPDGRKVTVCRQYDYLAIHGTHNAACAQTTKMGGQCDCPQHADIMALKAGLLAEAKEHGLTGSAPRPEPVDQSEPDETVNSQICPKCHSVCYGDCEAN